MKMALDLARKGWGHVSPNPMVGAVVVAEGQVVGKGYHEAFGSAHAEVNAINNAGIKAKGATLYVTLEPCNHTGRTPPCTHKILKSGIKRVVAAMKDPNPDVAGGGNLVLAENGVDVVMGVCEAEARQLNEFFIKFVRTKEPFVLVKCAATLDGRIATRTGDARWVSGETSRAYVHYLRHGIDGILVGIGTIRTDNPSLTTRLTEGRGKDPVRIILDTHLSIPEDARALHLDSDAATLIVTGNEVSEAKKKAITRLGAKVIQAPLKDGGIHLTPLMRRLGYIGITSLMIEGGSKVIASALRSRIADKIMIFYGPKILGGDDGVPMCAGQGPELMQQAMPVKSLRVRRFDQDIMIEGYPEKTRVY